MQTIQSIQKQRNLNLSNFIVVLIDKMNKTETKLFCFNNIKSGQIQTLYFAGVIYL